MKKTVVALSLFAISASASADLADKMEKLVGYTIVASMTIKSWYNESKNEAEENFKGCDYGRVIVFTNNKILKCTSYNYQYAYRPTAVILSDGSQFKMIVEDEIYEMQR